MLTATDLSTRMGSRIEVGEAALPSGKPVRALFVRHHRSGCRRQTGELVIFDNADAMHRVRPYGIASGERHISTLSGGEPVTAAAYPAVVAA